MVKPIHNLTDEQRKVIEDAAEMLANVGTEYDIRTASELFALIPSPPRVGPLGLTETTTRYWAKQLLDCGSSPHSNAGQNALIGACREQIAEWDKETS